MKQYLLVLCLVLCGSVRAQNGVIVGTGNPQGALDINNTSQGFLPPRVALQSVYDSLTVKNKMDITLPLPEGTFVWNTRTDHSEITKNNTKLNTGMYIWQNKRWRRILVSSTTLDSDEKGTNGPKFNDTNCSNWVEIGIPAGTNLEFENATIREIGMKFTGTDNYICEVELKLSFTSRIARDTEIFLISPSGKILELMDETGPVLYTTSNLNTIFSDTGNTNISSWNSGNFNNGKVKPQGLLNAPNYESHYSSGNITSFAGFVGDNPQGKWQLLINNRNVNMLYSTVITDAKLRLKTRENYTVPGEYKLVKELAFDTKENNTAIVKSTVDALVQSNVFHTVLTRSTTPVVVGTPRYNMTGLNVRSVNTTMNNGQSWVQLSNQDVDANLNTNTTYYYQLWYKGDVVGSNKHHSITINGVTKD